MAKSPRKQRTLSDLMSFMTFSFIIFYVLDLLPIRYTESQKLRLKMSMMTLLSLNGLRYSTAVSSASSSSVPASLTDLRSALLPSPQGATCACLVTPAAGYGWTRLRGCEPARLFSTVWVEIPNQRHWDSLPFLPIFVIWVEISNKQAWDSLPFSAVFHCLGRDFQPAALGFSTFSTAFLYLGRDFQPAALGISTFSAVFFLLGRDFQQASSGFSTLSADFRYLGRDFQQASSRFSTLSTDFRYLGRDSQPVAIGPVEISNRRHLAAMMRIRYFLAPKSI